jgi:hypothetical protein
MRLNELDIGPLPEDAHARLIHLSNVLGRVLFDSVRNPARERAQAMPEGVRREAEMLVDDVLYGVAQILDGVTRPIGNDRLDMQLVISARLRYKGSGEVGEVVELGPNGEGLCMGFAGWVEGDFGSLSS